MGAEVQATQLCTQMIELTMRSTSSSHPSLQPLVGPLDDLRLDDRAAVGAELAQQRERVGAHQLPHKPQGQRLHARHDVVSLNTDQHEAELLAQLDGVVAVAKDFHVPLGADLAEGLRLSARDPVPYQ